MVVEATVKSGAVEPSVPCTESLADGEVVPIESLVFALSQKNWVLFCEIRPFVPMNGIDPVVRADR